MIFLTVGTEYPFDRLLRSVDEAIPHTLTSEPVFAQIGESKYRPNNMEYVTKLSKSDYDRKMIESRGVISHAGIGTIILALELEKPLLVMPRLREYREHVNNHQVRTARRFEQLGYVIVAYRTQDLLYYISILHTFRPKCRLAEPEKIVKYIKTYLEGITR